MSFFVRAPPFPPNRDCAMRRVYYFERALAGLKCSSRRRGERETGTAMRARGRARNKILLLLDASTRLARRAPRKQAIGAMLASVPFGSIAGFYLLPRA